MKNVLFILTIAAVAAVSCVKADNNTAENTEQKATVSAVIDEEFAAIVKSDYEISGTTATFSWTSGDNFRRLVRAYDGNTWGNYAHYTYNISTFSGASASFTGTAVGAGYDDSGYALYPGYLTNGTSFYQENQSSLYLDLNESTTYDKDNPLKNVVPMLGKLSGTVYTFKPITGVIAITLNNIPNTATSVTLSTSDDGKGLSGGSVLLTSNGDGYKASIETLLGPSTIGLRNNWYADATYSKKTKTFTFSAGSVSNGTFYFAAPVGDFNTLTVTVKAGDTTLKEVSTTTTVTSTRGKITRLTAIDCAP